jgi:hypothetical protein
MLCDAFAPGQCRCCSTTSLTTMHVHMCAFIRYASIARHPTAPKPAFAAQSGHSNTCRPFKEGRINKTEHLINYNTSKWLTLSAGTAWHSVALKSPFSWLLCTLQPPSGMGLPATSKLAAAPGTALQSDRDQAPPDIPPTAQTNSMRHQADLGLVCFSICMLMWAAAPGTDLQSDKDQAAPNWPTT